MLLHDDSGRCIQLHDILRSGPHSTVFRGVQSPSSTSGSDGGTLVMVTCMNCRTLSDTNMSSLLQDIAFLSTCSHAHITKLYSAFVDDSLTVSAGAATIPLQDKINKSAERSHALYMVEEWVDGVSLAQCVNAWRSRTSPLEEEFIAAIAYDLLFILIYIYDDCRGGVSYELVAHDIYLDPCSGKVKWRCLRRYEAPDGCRNATEGNSSLGHALSELCHFSSRGSPFFECPAAAAIASLGVLVLWMARAHVHDSSVSTGSIIYDVAAWRYPFSPSLVTHSVSHDAPLLSWGGSAELNDFIACCLQGSAQECCTARKLVTHSFFRHCRGDDSAHRASVHSVLQTLGYSHSTRPSALSTDLLDISLASSCPLHEETMPFPLIANEQITDKMTSESGGVNLIWNIPPTLKMLLEVTGDGALEKCEPRHCHGPSPSSSRGARPFTAADLANGDSNLMENVVQPATLKSHRTTLAIMRSLRQMQNRKLQENLRSGGPWGFFPYSARELRCPRLSEERLGQLHDELSRCFLVAQREDPRFVANFCHALVSLLLSTDERVERFRRSTSLVTELQRFSEASKHSNSMQRTENTAGAGEQLAFASLSPTHNFAAYAAGQSSSGTAVFPREGSLPVSPVAPPRTPEEWARAPRMFLYSGASQGAAEGENHGKVLNPAAYLYNSWVKKQYMTSGQ